MPVKSKASTRFRQCPFLSIWKTGSAKIIDPAPRRGLGSGCGGLRRFPVRVALVHQIMTVAGTALVAKGNAQVTDIEPIIGALLTIGSVAWSVAAKRGR